jgi:hypothetical protein
MKFKYTMILLAGAAMFPGGGAAAAQTSVPEAATVGRPGAPNATPLRRAGPITGEPYSAHSETVSTQTLEDGTKIERKMSVTNSFRDSEGRTRLEHYIAPPSAKGEPKDLISVTIHDPVAGTAYLLNPREHTARQIARQSVLPADENAAPAESPVAATTSGGVTRMSRVSRGQEDKPHAKITTVDLGTQEMEGVAVTGTRITMEYPEGLVGNDRPFSVVTERWQSEELRLLVLTKRTDPRSGESVTRVTNLDRSEPDASLFQVPADYTIVRQETVPQDSQ